MTIVTFPWKVPARSLHTTVQVWDLGKYSLHSEETRQEGQGEKDEGQPTDSPQTCIQLQRLPSVPDANGFVHLHNNQLLVG